MQNTYNTIDNKYPDSEIELLTIQEACKFASQHLKKTISTSNISYLVQYGRIHKFGDNGNIRVAKHDLIKYYKSYHPAREQSWKKQLGNDLNWALSFEQYKEYETTKHVHRLHPYKGKFIPQLVEYFLDSHTDNFKKEVYFNTGDIILDPFCGSGTALVQANELGMYAVGIDVSSFNALISNIKIEKHNMKKLEEESLRITKALEGFLANSNTVVFENLLLEELKKFNNKYFPAPEYKYRVRRNLINEYKYAREKEKEFLSTYQRLISEFDIKLRQQKGESFLDKWYLQHVRKEIDYVGGLTHQLTDVDIKRIISLILSRTIRSCRATTHSDLATLKEPITTTYYCKKHGKICKPLFSIFNWWKRYSEDTLNRLRQFDKLRTDTHQICLVGDSRGIDIFSKVEQNNSMFAKLLKERKIQGIFSSPPYVGLINYHEQHAYAYDLFGFEREDGLEIGPLCRGQGIEAREDYVQGIADVLKNCKKFLAESANVFLVANDKWGLYPEIAKKADMAIINRFKRPVLNRTERDKGAYSEIIFHLRFQ